MRSPAHQGTPWSGRRSVSRGASRGRGAASDLTPGKGDRDNELNSSRNQTEPRSWRHMAWDFSTEPEFEEQLVWMRNFVRAEIWPIEAIQHDIGQSELERIY